MARTWPSASNIFSYEFTIRRNGQVVAAISKRWLTVSRLVSW
jgi:hypothetical protein